MDLQSVIIAQQLANNRGTGQSKMRTLSLMQRLLCPAKTGCAEGCWTVLVIVMKPPTPTPGTLFPFLNGLG